MKKITPLKSLTLLITLFCAVNFGYAQCGTAIATWDGSDWNWSDATPQNTVPTIGLTDEVIINSNYNTIAGGNQVSFSACNLTINIGATLTIADNDYVEVENGVVANGNITVETHGAFVQNDDASTFTGTGITTVRKSTTILNNWYDYTFWSSPVSGLTIGDPPLVDSDEKYWYNAANYLDVLQEVGNTNTFVFGSDDIDDNGDDWQYASNSTPMDVGVGFAATHSQIGYFGPVSYDYDFVGPFNNGVLTTGISYNAANTGGHWNLIGNPYPCALDFDAFYSANSGVVDGAAYLWSHSTPLSGTASGNNAYNFSQNDFAIITAGSGSINNSDNGDGIVPNDYIPSGQSFFIVGLSNANVTFNNSMRMADGTSNSQFFKTVNSKNKSTSIANKLWINLTSDNGVFNQVLVAYVDGATDNNDGMAFDATRNFSSGVASIIYTTIEGEDKKYAIQGKAPSSINEDEIFPLGFYTSITSPTIYKFSIANIQGEYLTGNPVYLKDNLLNQLHDLSASDYTFTSEVGEFNDRFEIAFNSAALSTTDVALNSKSLKIIELEDDSVQFTASDDLRINTVIIFDLLGRQLYSFKGNNASETYTLNNLHSSIYIAKVELSNGALITKKAIKK